MTEAADWPDRLDDCLLERIRRGDDAETLLLGMRADVAPASSAVRWTGCTNGWAYRCPELRTNVSPGMPICTMLTTVSRSGR